MKNKDFEKAREKKSREGLFYLFFSFALLIMTYPIYIGDCCPLDILFFVIGVSLFIISLSCRIDYIESKYYPKKYSLCKRCKCLIKKDKIFCSDCRVSIRLSLKKEENKKYFNEYKTLIKKEKKK